MKIHVARRIDEIQLIGLAVGGRVAEAHRGCLDGDAPLALQIHAVEKLRLLLARGQSAGRFQQAIRQGRLAVIDVRDDREIPYLLDGGRH